jgi:hypothetical protein
VYGEKIDQPEGEKEVSHNLEVDFTRIGCSSKLSLEKKR